MTVVVLRVMAALIVGLCLYVLDSPRMPGGGALQ